MIEKKISVNKFVLDLNLHVFVTFFVSPELSSVRDYVITHSVRSLYVVCT